MEGLVKYQVVGFTADDKRVTIRYTRSAFEASEALANGDPRFLRVAVYDDTGEVTQDDLNHRAQVKGKSGA